VKRIYIQSWIGQYFNYAVDDDNTTEQTVDIIVFKNADGETLVSNRFTIYMHIPENTKKYFLPDYEWTTTFRYLNSLYFIPVDALSLIQNGFLTKPYPYSESQIYSAPFFILLKSYKGLQSNYLGFNENFKPNTDSCILAMLNYNVDSDTFYPKFSLGIWLSYSKSVLCDNILEFVLVDSNKKKVQIEDKSQLFVSLKIISS
jgi:hypothetical protein